jgi:bacillithiol synthase
MRNNPSVHEIPFRKLPHQTSLFIDYVEGAPRALSFYEQPPMLDAVEKLARELATARSFPRREIASILERQNALYGADQSALLNIRQLLRDEDCVAVITGQQVGLFGGPLYTIYKAATALRVCAGLKARGIRAIPIFWMDAEDHDLAEVTEGHINAAGGGLTTKDFRAAIFGDQPPEGVSVGSIAFPAGIREAVAEYAAGLPEGNWETETRSRLEINYAPGFTFAEAFGSLITQLFQGTGLVLFDPQDPAVKQLLQPLFSTAIEASQAICDSLRRRNQALEDAGFTPQVTVLEDSTVLFLLDDGRRRALIRTENGFALKGSYRTFTQPDLLGLCTSSPELFSPNVLLRPMAQEHLFPTVAYVGGPSETAYFAQTEPLYRKYERPMPVVWPRAAFTLIGVDAGADMRRYGIELQDCFEGREHLLEKMLGDSSGARSMLENMERELNSTLEEVRPAMVSADPSLESAAETAKRKILHRLEGLRSRFLRFETGRAEDLTGKADRIMSCCYPNLNLQERELTVHPFLARYGSALMNVIYSCTDPERFVHRVLHL